MVNDFTIISKTNITSLSNSLNTKKTRAYDVGKPGPGLRQAQTCGEVKSVRCDVKYLHQYKYAMISFTLVISEV